MRSARLARLPLRVRLVAGFSVAMLVVLAAAGTFVYWRVEYALDRGLDTELGQATATIRPLVDGTGHVDRPVDADATGVAWQVLDGSGAVVDSGRLAPAHPIVGDRDLDAAAHGPLTRDIGDMLPIADQPYRVHLTPLGRGRVLLVAVRRDHRDEALRELLAQLTVAGLGALVVTALVGDLLARAALRPVERYRRRAEEIASGATGLRLEVPPDRDDEVTRLGHTLNEMLGALERSLEHERRFVNDASHELRTPLTLLKSRIQLARRRNRTTEEHERVLDELAVDVGRLARLAEDLLALGASAEGRQGTAEVNRVVDTVVERRRLDRPEHAHEVRLELAGESVTAAVSPLVLERVVTNLLDNAAVHGTPPVGVAVDRVDGWVRLVVHDAGPGMPPDLLARATGRFTRSDEARGRPGAGLGLSLVQQLVTGAGGELRLCSGGEHVRYGRAVPLACEHGPEMTVSVLLPVAAS